MAAKKCFCCRLFLCFSDKQNTVSAQSEPPDQIVNAPIDASSAFQSNSPSVAASSSQANAPKDVTVIQNDSQRIASSAASTVTSFPSSSSSQNIASAHGNVFQVGSSSTPSSSSVPKESDHTHNVREAAGSVDIENVDADLNDLSKYISQLLKFIQEKKTGNKESPPKPGKDYWLASKNFIKLKEVLSEGINVVKDVLPGDTKTIVRGFLQGMGMAHMVTASFLVVGNILERYEKVTDNQEACLSLFKEMCILAEYVKQLKKLPELKAAMEDPIKEATELIVEAAFVCCTQIDKSKFSEFFSTTVDGETLTKFGKELTKTYTHIQTQMNIQNCQMDIQIYHASKEIKERLQKPRELQYPQYPKDAVGIEKPLENVNELLEWESDKKAVAILLHGFGGMGKTTLGDAVFARVLDENIKGCKYSFVRLFDSITSTPDIVKLQTSILKDLMMVEEREIPEIRRFEDGRVQIGKMLEKEVVFLYIDNVLDRYQLDNLLPRDMGNVKKLRLLVTARENDVLKQWENSSMKTEIYAMKELPDEEAKRFLEEKNSARNRDGTEQINSRQLDDIVKMCGGVPKLLEVVAGFMSSEVDKQNAYLTVMKQKEKNWEGEGEIGKNIASYFFAYETLEETLKDAFLDICSFFHGWHWEAVANIVGESELKMLEKRALVTKDTHSTAKVHDVILQIGNQKSKGTRFTSTNQIQNFLEERENEDIGKIKGIWLTEEHSPWKIPASKLDLMYRSLRVLKLGTFKEVDGKCNKVFENLILFEAEISRLPFNVSKFKEFRNLKHICYKSEDLSNLIQMPSTLRHIEFKFDGEYMNSRVFKISSNCLQQLSNLRVLRLEGIAQSARLLQELGDVVKGLQELTLLRCKDLEELPVSISKFRSLRVLRMDYCSRLRQLPEDFGSLNYLQELHLQCCESLITLPESLEKLSSLRLLNLSCCRNLKDLPYGLGKLTSLVELQLSGCGELCSIPDSIGQLKSLGSSIDLSFLYLLKELPDEFCNLSFITILQMDHCCDLEKLPDPFGKLTSLRKLILRNCYHLKKLPESFGQLKYLEHLDLSMCTILEELCIDFNCLSSLRFLSLDSCELLKKLPEDFHCLSSLEFLSLRDCDMLEGKCMKSMLKMKTLQSVRINGSALLEERWEEYRRQGDQSFSFAVYTRQGLSNEKSKENILKELQSKFDSILTDGEGEPFSISHLPPNALLLVMIDCREEFHHDFPLSLIEKNIYDLPTKFKMIYFGKHFQKLSKEVAATILGHGPCNSEAEALFEKVFAISLGRNMSIFGAYSEFQMSAKIVSDEKGDKYLSGWEELSPASVEEFVIKKCGRYLKLKQLVEKPLESNIELLRALFASGEEESTLGFLKNDASEVPVEEMEGKTI